MDKPKIMYLYNDELEPFLQGAKFPAIQKFPEPRKEITVEEFFAKLLLNGWGMERMGIEQIYDDRFWNCHFFLFHNQALMTAEHPLQASDNHHPASGLVVQRNSQYFWIRFFLLGCEHEYQRVSLGNFDHRDTCIHCGYSYVVNSSG